MIATCICSVAAIVAVAIVMFARRNVVNTLKQQIREAFANVVYPGDDRLRGSDQGEEPYLLERDFRGKRNWRTIDAAFLDQAPDGFGSALSFFSDEAFRFYLPAYLLADIDDRLDRADPVFHLTHGMTDAEMPLKINPRLYGDETWIAHVRRRFAAFESDEIAAIIAYLQYMRGHHEFDAQRIDEALRNYWLPRLK